MKKLILFIAILFVGVHLQAQDQEKITTDFTIYEVSVWLEGTTKLVHGAVFSVTDSTLTISNSGKKYDYIDGNYSTTVYRLDQIYEVTYKRVRGGGVGAIIGLVGGGVIGGIVGNRKERKLYGHYRPLKPKVGKYAGIGALVGGTLGVLIGAQRVRGVPTPNSKVLRKLKERAIKQ